RPTANWSNAARPWAEASWQHAASSATPCCAAPDLNTASQIRLGRDKRFASIESRCPSAAHRSAKRGPLMVGEKRFKARSGLGFSAGQFARVAEQLLVKAHGHGAVQLGLIYHRVDDAAHLGAG